MEIDERKLKEEFEASQSLRSEFSGVDAFIALRKHEFKVAQKADRLDRRKKRKSEVEVDEAKLKAEFEASQALQDEFHDVTAYVAFKKAEAVGVETFSSPAPDIKVKKKRFKTIPISPAVQSCMKEAVARAGILEDEQRQVDSGVPCDADGVPLES